MTAFLVETPCNVDTIIHFDCNCGNLASTPSYREIDYRSRLLASQTHQGPLDNELRLRPRTARMRTIRMSTKLDLFVRPQLHRLLEPLPNLHQRLFTRTISSLSFADRPRPESDPKECLPDIDDHAHDLVVIVFFKGLADGGELCMEPQFVDVDSFLVFELVGPFAAVLVLRVFPFGTHAAFEEVVVGFVG